MGNDIGKVTTVRDKVQLGSVQGVGCFAFFLELCSDTPGEEMSAFYVR